MNLFLSFVLSASHSQKMTDILPREFYTVSKMASQPPPRLLGGVLLHHL